MNTARDVPTWRIVSGPDDHFSWSPVHGDAESSKGKHPRIPIPKSGHSSLPRIPSMSDLLLHAPLQLLGERGGSESGVIPMFTTGSGRPVSVKRSSIQTAAVVLGGSDESRSMLRTGSGRSVSVRKNSIQKEVTILNESEKSERGCGSVNMFHASGEALPLFTTGSGKPVSVNKSSLKKAATLLKGDLTGKGMVEKQNDIGAFNFPTSLSQTDMVEKQNDIGAFNFPTSLFQTGSGKTVDISSTGIQRATALLGLDENHVALAPCIKNMTNQTSKSSCLERLPVDYGSTGMPFSEPVELKVFDMNTSALVTSPVRFHTAGGKSLSISADALQRARNLLGGLDSGIDESDDAADSMFSSVMKKSFHENPCEKENFHCFSPYSERPNLLQIPLEESICVSEHLVAIPKMTISLGTQINKSNFASKCIYKSKSRTEKEEKYLGKPLVDISNKIGSGTHMHLSREKKSHRTSSISPFKRPRMSRFSTPLNGTTSLATTGKSVPSASKGSYQNRKMSARFPCQPNRKSILEYFGAPSLSQNMLLHLSDQVRHMSADKAAVYRFTGPSSFEGIGAENFQNMLIQSGASLLQATKKWVQNHYKWIVWKLACLERSYPQKAGGKYLTVTNVLEELKYRYEREVNHGHRSAVKKILDGDASPASMVVLCVSAIHGLSENNVCKVDDPNSECDKTQQCNDGHKNNHAVKIELTDGWYSLNATLDGALSIQVMSGKLFVGQKLRIWGATLCGWIGPISPLEASEVVCLQLHINGTYRAHWAERLGFCKGCKFPLAFRCIKAAGGPIPKTLIGIIRIYPTLYKERFPEGGSVVRSERMESEVENLYNQRRILIAEGIVSEQDKDITENDSDNDEGAKIFKVLQMSAEPELLMADMTSQQLMSFSNYQAKQEAIREDNVQRKIEKALKEAGLTSRDVCPYMRVKVVGLTRKGSLGKCPPVHGLITIWNPTEKQKVDLVEGQMYLVSGLVPLGGGSDIINLQTRGFSSIWRPLPLTANEKFEPFFTPRHSALLSNLEEVPQSSEFDIAAVVLFIGDVYITGHQKKQWVFVTDGSHSGSNFQQERMHSCLLAVSFCLPCIDKDMSPLVNPTLLGSTVCFYNLVKRTRDQLNQLWVAEATESSTYSLITNVPSNSHVKEAGNNVSKWAEQSSLIIQKLREQVLHIVGHCGG